MANFSEEQAKVLILEVLNAEFKGTKRDTSKIASLIVDKINSLTDGTKAPSNGLNRQTAKNSTHKIVDGKTTTGHAVMTQRMSSANDDASAKAWDKTKQGLAYEKPNKKD